MAGRARVADLSVVPSIAPREDEFWMAVRDAALFQSGRPVLVIPEETPSRFLRRNDSSWPRRTVWSRFAPSRRQNRSLLRPSASCCSPAPKTTMTTFAGGDCRLSRSHRAESGNLEDRLEIRHGRQGASARGFECSRDAAGHGRLRPLAMARMGVWRRHPRGAARHRCAGSDGD